MAEFLRFNPSGLIQILPPEVVTGAPVSRYDTLPQEAGLARLVETGVLGLVDKSHDLVVEPENQGDGTFVLEGERHGMGETPGRDIVIHLGGFAYTRDDDGFWRGRLPDTLIVHRGFRYPADLTGAHAVTFRIAPDIPPPTGHPGDSELVTGR